MAGEEVVDIAAGIGIAGIIDEEGRMAVTEATGSTGAGEDIINACVMSGAASDGESLVDVV